jgi:hypothetical protein
MMTERTAPPLNRSQFESLRAIGNAMHLSILPAHRDLLIAFGYVAVVDGGLQLTDAGRERLAAGGWFVFFDWSGGVWHMASDDNSPAKIAIIEEWNTWASKHPWEAKTGTGFLFFVYLKKFRPDLLLDFKSKGDKWQIVHTWLLSAGKVKH